MDAIVAPTTRIPANLLYLGNNETLAILFGVSATALVAYQIGREKQRKFVQKHHRTIVIIKK